MSTLEEQHKSRCNPCDRGYYISKNDSSCTRCPDPHHTTTPFFVASEEELLLAGWHLHECICQAGFYFRPNHGCAQCGEGLKCDEGVAVPTQESGYKVEMINELSREYSIYQCPAKGACSAGVLGSCSGGASGRMCLQCPSVPDQMYWSESKRQCVKCGDSGGGSWVFPVALICLAVVMVIIYFMALPEAGKEELTATMEVATVFALLVLLFQVASLYGRLDIPWGHPLDDILKMCRVFALDFGILQLDCALGFNYVWRFIFGSAFPMLGALVYFFSALALQRAGYVDAPLRCWNAVGMIFQGLFIGFLLHGIKPFLVYEHPNGELSMVSGPEIRVGTSDHDELAACGVVHLIVYGGGFMAYCSYACWQLHRRAQGRDARGVRAVLWYHFLVFKFKPSRYYFGLIALMRSLIIAVVPILVSSPHVQIVLLQCVVCSYLVTHTLLWPYRFSLHNFVDLSTSAAMVSLTTGAAFFLPGSAGRSVVNSVLAILVACMLVFLVVLGLTLWHLLRPWLMSKEARAKIKEMERKEQAAFFAELQHIEEQELVALHIREKDVDVTAVCAAPLPSVSADSLMSCEDLTSRIVDLVPPSAHPGMQDVQEGFKILEARLRWRAQEFADATRSHGIKRSAKSASAVRSPLPSWTEKERAQIMTLTRRTQAFLKAYARSLLDNTNAMQQLGGYVAGMEQQFKGMYAACVRDILQRQTGFDEAIGIARALQRAAADESQSLPPLCVWERQTSGVEQCIELMEAAAHTQEAVLLYAKALAAATGATAPRSSMKRLYRVLEKQALDPGSIAANAAMSSVCDAARSMILCESMEQLVRALRHIRSDHDHNMIKILRVKERFSQPTGGGWSDVLINFQFPVQHEQSNPLVWELQLVHAHMLVVRKDLGGHESYAKYRVAREILDMQEAEGGTVRKDEDTNDTECDRDLRKRTL